MRHCSGVGGGKKKNRTLNQKEAVQWCSGAASKTTQHHLSKKSKLGSTSVASFSKALPWPIKVDIPGRPLSMLCRCCYER